MPTKSHKGRWSAGAILALAAAVAIGVFIAVKQVPPILTGSGCHVGPARGAVSLDPEQAANAATIAGVAHRRAMPPQAVTIAYAAAMQESHLHNFAFGDRDSVGIFQQRPSEGWGPAAKLKDPIYATTRFFQALVTVHGYQRMPVYKAAQAVQRSADGDAYIQYQSLAAQLTKAFTGHAPRAVWCWGSTTSPHKAKFAAAHAALVKTFGSLASRQATAPHDAPSLVVGASHPALGWAITTWLVTHAGQYRLHDVKYAGFQWQAGTGRSGWAPVKGGTTLGQVRAS